MNVLVFKTNMVGAGCKQTVTSALACFGTALQWNVDLEDNDKILRVETAAITPQAIIQAMHQVGFTCEELS
jgi:hypothetical protein